MGRKRNDAKRVEVVDAFIAALIEVGLEQATMVEVGKRIGLDRSTLHYYFKTRDKLVEAATVRISDAYVDRLRAKSAELSGEEGPHELISYLFGPEFHDHDLSIAIDEFATAGNRDPKMGNVVRDIYQAIEDMLTGELLRFYPDVPASERHKVMLCIVSMLDGAINSSLLGLDPQRINVTEDLSHDLLRRLSAMQGSPASASVVEA